MKAIKFLLKITSDISKSANAAINLKEATYHIINNNEILGEMRESRKWNSVEIYLHTNVFQNSLGMALSVFLHEHSHIVGYDGSRAFTDLLTVVIKDCIDKSAIMNKAKKEWTELIKTI